MQVTFSLHHCSLSPMRRLHPRLSTALVALLVLLSLALASTPGGVTAAEPVPFTPAEIPATPRDDGNSNNTNYSNEAPSVYSRDYQPTARPPVRHVCAFDHIQEQLQRRYGNVTRQAAAHVVHRADREAAASGSIGALLSRAKAAFSLTGRASSNWAPLRIAVFTEDLNDPNSYCTRVGDTRPDFLGSTATCTEDQVLTDAKKNLLVNYIIPEAIKLHEERLTVHPLDNLVVSPISYYPDFHPPASHLTQGVSGADFVLYLAAGPTSGRTVAWASPVQFDYTSSGDGRPVVGVANMSPEFIENSTYTIRVIAHELLHALGFSNNLFDSLTTSANPGDASGYNLYTNVRGKTTTVPGLSSPNALAAARTHYGCSSMNFVELEDMGGSGTRGSHWKLRNAQDELMAPVSGMGVYTAMTIGAMEDLGFYKGVYSKAEPMTWGSGAGCSLFDEKCIVSGSTTQPSMFCDSDDDLTCPSDRMGIGHCRIETFNSMLPPAMQYFASPYVGGVSLYMDYCPAREAYSNLYCADGDTSMMPGSVISPSARCFDASSSAGVAVSGSRAGQTALCIDVKCSQTERTYQVRVKGAANFVDCPEGSTIAPRDSSSAFGSGAIVCAPYAEVCFSNNGGVFGGDGAAGASGLATATTASVVLLFLTTLFVL